MKAIDLIKLIENDIYHKFSNTCKKKRLQLRKEGFKPVTLFYKNGKKVNKI